MTSLGPSRLELPWQGCVDDMTPRSHHCLIKALGCMGIALVFQACLWGNRHALEYGRLLVFSVAGAGAALMYILTRLILRSTAPVCENCGGRQQWEITKCGDVKYFCPACRSGVVDRSGA